MNLRSRFLSNCILIAALAAAAASQANASPTPMPRATAPGGSHQLTALEGCMNQWLFNGIWRVRVLKVDPIMREGTDHPGYAVTVEVRNGSHALTSLSSTGIPLLSDAGNLVLDDGNPLDFLPQDNVQWATLYNQMLPPSAGFTYGLKFFYDMKPAAVAKPQKWLLQIDPHGVWQGAPRYTVGDPSLRVNLTCNKGAP